jgi:hypothetical protein
MRGPRKGTGSKAAGSRLFRGEVSDVGAREIRRTVEAIVSNDRAALFIFGLGVLAVILLDREGDWIRVWCFCSG